MKWYRFFKSADGGKTVTVDNSVKNFKIGNGYGVGDEYIPTGTYADDFRLQIYVKQTDEPSGGAISTAAYFKTENTADIGESQLTTVAVRTYLGFDIADAYGVQSHLTIPTTMSTTADNAHLTAISGKVTFTGTPTVTKGWVTAGLFIVEGTGTCSQMCHGVSIVQEAGSTGMESLLHLYSDVDIANAFSFSGTSGSGHMIYTATDTHQTFVGSIKILVNGAEGWIHYCDAQAATS
jgi:hypothetical protein